MNDNFMHDFEVNHHGIFQPIRAYVFDGENKNSDEIIQEAFHAMKYWQTNAIVGYFAASDSYDPKQPHCTTGFSFINPGDYVIGQMDKKISKIKAASHAMNQKKKISGRMIHNQYMVTDGTIVYVLHETLRQQYRAFIDRCNRYFKKK